MSEFLLLLLIVVLLLCLVATVGGYLIYSGLLVDVDVKTGPPPITKVTFAYKFKEGAYKDCGAAFTETCSIGPKQRTIGVFYDDPEQEHCDLVYLSIYAFFSSWSLSQLTLKREAGYFL